LHSNSTVLNHGLDTRITETSPNLHSTEAIFSKRESRGDYTKDRTAINIPHTTLHYNIPPHYTYSVDDEFPKRRRQPNYTHAVDSEFSERRTDVQRMTACELFTELDTAIT